MIQPETILGKNSRVGSGTEPKLRHDPAAGSVPRVGMPIQGSVYEVRCAAEIRSLDV